MRKFKRSTNSIVGIILLAICVFYLILLFQIKCAYGVTPTVVNLLVSLCFFFVASIIVLSLVPPDFKYSINVTNDCIIFEMSKEDHRRLDKSFAIASKTRNYITLDDGFSRIRIAYNENVLKFLKQINN